MSKKRNSLFPDPEDNPFNDLPSIHLGSAGRQVEVPRGALIMANDICSVIADRQSSSSAMSWFADVNSQKLVYLSGATIKERIWGLIKGVRNESKVASAKAKILHRFLAEFDPTRILGEDGWETTLLAGEAFNLPAVGKMYEAACHKKAPRLRTDIFVALQAHEHDMIVASNSVATFKELRKKIPFPGIFDPLSGTSHI